MKLAESHSFKYYNRPPDMRSVSNTYKSLAFKNLTDGLLKNNTREEDVKISPHSIPLSNTVKEIDLSFHVKRENSIRESVDPTKERNKRRHEALRENEKLNRDKKEFNRQLIELEQLFAEHDQKENTKENH